MIKLSPKHGLSPSLSLCFFCGQEKNEVIIPGHLKDDQEASRQAVWNKEPCQTCQEYMKQGIILISIDEKKSIGDMSNPYRTGKFCVVRDDFIKRVVSPPELSQQIIDSRVSFIDDETWKFLQLPE